MKTNVKHVYWLLNNWDFNNFETWDKIDLLPIFVLYFNFDCMNLVVSLFVLNVEYSKTVWVEWHCHHSVPLTCLCVSIFVCLCCVCVFVFLSVCVRICFCVCVWEA